MGVLLLHQSHILVFELVSHQNTLRLVSKLHEGLENATTIVFEAQLGVLFTNSINALLYESVFIFA